MITRADGRALVFERSDVPGAWQFPQGGIARHEDPLSAVMREVREETGIEADQLQLCGRYPEPLVYVLPPEARSRKSGLGQVQWWFVFRYEGRTDQIELPPRGEIRSWAWRPLEEIVREAADFRRSVYQRLEEFVVNLERSAAE